MSVCDVRVLPAAPHTLLAQTACSHSVSKSGAVASHLLLCDLGGGPEALRGPRPEVGLCVPHPVAVQRPQLMTLHMAPQSTL